MDTCRETRDSESDTEKAERQKALLAGEPELADTKLLWDVSHLCKRADVADESAKQLLRCIITASSDNELLDKITCLKKFPAKDETNYITNMVETLGKRVAQLEEKRVDLKKKPDKEAEKSAEKDRFEIDKEKSATLPGVQPVSKMYKDMKCSTVILSLASEIRQLRKEYDTLIKNQDMIRESSSDIKGQRAWNLLCKCIEEVDNMRSVLNTMTDGQFGKGIIEYVDPRRVEKLENKMEATGNKLQKMEDDVDQLKNFKQETEDMLAKCSPILEQLHIAELKEDTYAQDMKQANEISDRIGEMELNVEYMSNLTALLLSRLEGRIALIDATVKKMELLKEAKADKDYVVLVLPDKADIKLVQKAVSFDEMRKTYHDITGKLKTMIESLKHQMVIWNDKLQSLINASELKIKALDFLDLLSLVEKTIKKFYKELQNLQDGHRREKVIRSAEDRKKFKNMQCISCDKDAIMNCAKDVGLPFLEESIPKKSVGPPLMYQLHHGGDSLTLLRNRVKFRRCSSLRVCCPLQNTCTYCERGVKYTYSRPPSTAQESVVRVIEFNDYCQAQYSSHCGGSKVKVKDKSSTQKSLQPRRVNQKT